MEARVGDVAYTSDEVSRRTGVAYRTLMRWVEQGLFGPLRDPRRQRSPLRWTAQGVCEVYVAGQLSARGMPIEVVRAVLLHLRDMGTNPFLPGLLLWLKQASDIGAVVEIVRSPERALDLLRRGSALLPLVPPGMEADVEAVSAPIEVPAPPPPEGRAPSSLPLAVACPGVAELDGCLYVVGGKVALSHWNQAHYNTLLRLDPGTGAWSQLASFPAARARIAAVGAWTRLYAIGGAAQIGNYGVRHDFVDTYEPSTGLWSSGPRLPYPLVAGAAALYEGEIWLVGVDSDGPSDRVLVLDGPEGRWRDGPRLPVACHGGGAAVVGGQFWYVGTHGGGGEGWVLYHEHGRGWRVAATSLPTPRHDYSVAGDGERIYVVGGASGWLAWWDRVDVFDPKAGAWSQGPPLIGGGRTLHGCAVVGSHLYSVGGQTWVYTVDNRVYRIALPLAPGATWQAVPT